MCTDRCARAFSPVPNTISSRESRRARPAFDPRTDHLHVVSHFNDNNSSNNNNSITATRSTHRRLIYGGDLRTIRLSRGRRRVGGSRSVGSAQSYRERNSSANASDILNAIGRRDVNNAKQLLLVGQSGFRGQKCAFARFRKRIESRSSFGLTSTPVRIQPSGRSCFRLARANVETTPPSESGFANVSRKSLCTRRVLVTTRSGP